MTERLPLFPLSTVLYPGANLTLHIFEARYRLMIERCLEQNTPFGVVLIRDGREVGDQGVVPYSIGTVAEMTETVRLDDGRYYLAAIGRQRFRIQYPLQRQPYMLAAVATLTEDPVGVAVAPASELRAMYRRYWDVLTQVTGQDQEGDELEVDPIAMSYQLADKLQVPNATKQRWLEVDVLTRLYEMGNALRQELRLLPRPPASGSGSPLGSLN